MCITSLLPLLHPLLFGVNARHEWVTYICFVNVIWRFWYTFWTHQLPRYFCLHLWDKIGITWFVTLCSLCSAFITSWCFVCPTTHVWLGWSCHVNFSQFPTHDLAFIPYFSFLFFIASFSSCGHFVSLELSPSSLSFPPFSGKFFLWALPFPLFSSFHGRFFLG